MSPLSRIVNNLEHTNFGPISYVDLRTAGEVIDEVRTRFLLWLREPAGNGLALASRRFEWVASAFLPQGTGVFVVMSEALASDERDQQVLRVSDGRYASFLAWQADLGEYLIVDERFSFVIAIDSDRVRWQGDIGMPAAVAARAQA